MVSSEQSREAFSSHQSSERSIACTTRPILGASPGIDQLPCRSEMPRWDLARSPIGDDLLRVTTREIVELVIYNRDPEPLRCDARDRIGERHRVKATATCYEERPLRRESLWAEKLSDGARVFPLR